MVLQLGLALCWGLQTGRTITTDYLPSRELPNYVNPKDAPNPGHTKGWCNGLDELSRSMQQVRKNNPNALTMTEVVGIIQKYHGPEYLNSVMAKATEMAYSKGDVQTHITPVAKDFANDVVLRMAKTREPQSIVLQQANGDPHRVTVYGAEKTESGWQFKISDSNHPQTAIADLITLNVDTKSGKLTSTIPGGATESWTQGGVVPKPAMPPEKYIDLVYTAILGKDLPFVPKPPPPVERNFSVEAINDPEAGGVLIRFDPTLFTGAVDESKLSDINKRIGNFLASQSKGAVILNLEPQVRQVSLVPFATLSPTGPLGGLTRVTGFVVKPDGTTFLAGLKEPGKPAIPGEWLSVGLQSIYAKGLDPFISLDPDPKTYSGPQMVRIGDIPTSLRSTSFIKTMLEADYLMKKINLGKVVPQVDGFTNYVDRVIANSSAGTFRMWFTPHTLPAADSYIYHHDGSLAVMFESQVSLLSEREKSESQIGYTSSQPDGIAEQASQNFTEHFDELAAKYPEFYRLRGVFDIAKLSVAWRALQVKPKGADVWLNYVPPKVEIPATYAGIGPEMTKDGIHVVSGGAIARARFKLASTVETDRLEPMISQAGKSDASIELPATLPIAESSRADFEAQGLIAAAQRDMATGQFDNALDDVEQVLSISPDDDDALALKASALGLLKRYSEATAVVEKLLPRNPRMAAMRSLLKVGAGDTAGGLADATAAEAEFSDSEGVLAICAAARLLALDADGAAKTLRLLRAVSPAFPAISSIEAQVDLIRFLGPEKARERLAMQEQIPPSIAVVFLQSPFSPGGIAAYKGVLEKLQTDGYPVPPKLHVLERVRLGMACAALINRPGADDLALIGKGVDQMVADHPDWPSSYLARFCVLAAIDGPANLAVGALDKFAELEPKSDPILPEIQLVTRMPRMAPYLAAMAAVDPGSKPELRSLMAALAADLMKGQPGEQFFRLLGLNPKVDVGALNQAIKQGVMFGNADDVTKALAQMTTTVGAISGSDAAFLPALCYCADAAQLMDQNSPEYAEMLRRATKLSTAGAPSRYLAPLAAKYRAQIWLRLALEPTRTLLGRDSAALKALAPVMEPMDRLHQPASSTDSLASVSKVLETATKALGTFIRSLRSSVAASIASTRTQSGDFTADVELLCVAEMQSQMNTDGTADLKKLVDLHPGIEKTPAYAGLLALYKDMSQGMFVSEPEQLTWLRVLIGMKDRYDALSVEELLSALTGMLPKKSETFAKYTAQCKIKSEMAL